MRPEEVRGKLCFPCGSNSCFPGGWTRNTWRLEELRELPYPATSTSLTWLAGVRGHVTSGLWRTGTGQLGPGTALSLCSRAGAAAGAKLARRFYLTFTNGSCHSLLGVFWALAGKTSHPVSSRTNWSFPVLEAFITKLFLSSSSHLTWAELCSLSLSQALRESAFFSNFCEIKK